MEYLLAGIIVLLALNLLVNVSIWSRESAAYQQFVFQMRKQRRARKARKRRLKTGGK